MIISGNVIAHRFFVNGTEIDDNVSCQLPSLETATADVKGAGIMGTISMPSTGQFNSMTFTANMRATHKNAYLLLVPGIINIELRFAKDVLTADGQKISEGTKIFISGLNKKYDPGKVETANSMDSVAEFEVLRYRQVIDGEEAILIDKRNYIYKINGVDYMEKVRAAL